ncbi:hypothetical protein Tco_1256286 [Tanacetum coccineum]
MGLWGARKMVRTLISEALGSQHKCVDVVSMLTLQSQSCCILRFGICAGDWSLRLGLRGFRTLLVTMTSWVGGWGGGGVVGEGGVDVEVGGGRMYGCVVMCGYVNGQGGGVDRGFGGDLGGGLVFWGELLRVEMRVRLVMGLWVTSDVGVGGVLGIRQVGFLLWWVGGHWEGVDSLGRVSSEWAGRMRVVGWIWGCFGVVVGWGVLELGCGGVGSINSFGGGLLVVWGVLVGSWECRGGCWVKGVLWLGLLWGSGGGVGILALGAMDMFGRSKCLAGGVKDSLVGLGWREGCSLGGGWGLAGTGWVGGVGMGWGLGGLRIKNRKLVAVGVLGVWGGVCGGLGGGVGAAGGVFVVLWWRASVGGGRVVSLGGVRGVIAEVAWRWVWEGRGLDGWVWGGAEGEASGLDLDVGVVWGWSVARSRGGGDGGIGIAGCGGEVPYGSVGEVEGDFGPCGGGVGRRLSEGVGRWGSSMVPTERGGFVLWECGCGRVCGGCAGIDGGEGPCGGSTEGLAVVCGEAGGCAREVDGEWAREGCGGGYVIGDVGDWVRGGVLGGAWGWLGEGGVGCGCACAVVVWRAEGCDVVMVRGWGLEWWGCCVGVVGVNGGGLGVEWVEGGLGDGRDGRG